MRPKEGKGGVDSVVLVWEKKEEEKSDELLLEILLGEDELLLIYIKRERILQELL